MADVDDTNRCTECGSEVIDPHVTSNLTQRPAPSQPASQPLTTASIPRPVVTPAYPPIEAKTRPGCLTIYATLLFLGSASFLCIGIFGSISPLLESEDFPSQAAGITMALVGAFMFILAIGLWYLKNWARIAVIVMQSLGIVMSIFSVYTALTTTSTALNQNISPILTIAVAIIAISLQITIISWFIRNGHYFKLPAKTDLPLATTPLQPGVAVTPFTITPPQPTMGQTRDAGISPSTVPPTGAPRYSAQTAIAEVATLVSEALEIIETKAVQIIPGGIIKSGGDTSIAMDAAKKLEQAHRLQPDVPWLHYAWASALHLAMQYQTAREEMERLLETHPTFHWAKFAVDGWDHWDGLFTLPPWYPGITTVHQAISAEVKLGYVLGTRQKLEPRATLFLRDTGDDFQGLTTLESTRIDITTVLSDSEPLLAVVYARIWDNPTNPFQVEALGLPLYPHGSKQRCKYEYLCLQEDIDFAIINNRDNILLNKRLTIPDRMKSVHAVLWDRLSTLPGRDYSDMELVNTVRAFQSRFSLSDVQY
jgi:hypothetical protein